MRWPRVLSKSIAELFKTTKLESTPKLKDVQLLIQLYMSITLSMYSNALQSAYMQAHMCQMHLTVSHWKCSRPWVRDIQQHISITQLIIRGVSTIDLHVAVDLWFHVIATAKRVYLLPSFVLIKERAQENVNRSCNAKTFTSDLKYIQYYKKVI